MYLPERQPGEAGKNYALRAIRENIIRLDLAPGARVSENALAAEMGLSRTPVGEALNELSKCRIVEVAPQKSSRIALIDYELVEEARFIREVLECAVVEQVCALAAPEDLRGLHENIKLQNFCLTNQDPDMLLRLDNQFHRMLFVIARKPQAYAMMENASVHFDRVRSMSLSTVKDLKIVQDHQMILESIAQKDAALARAQMKVHLNRYKVDEATIRERYPDYFMS